MQLQKAYKYMGLESNRYQIGNKTCYIPKVSQFYTGKRNPC